MENYGNTERIRKRNIILLTIDALRPDRIGVYEYNRGYTPNIDRIAKNGVVFKNAFSVGPYTSFSFPAILGSIYPSFLEESSIRNALVFSKKYFSLAQVLKKGGYHTIGLNPGNAFISRYFGYSRGFDHFNDFMDVKKSENFILKLMTRTREFSLFKKINKKFFNKLSALLLFISTYYEVIIAKNYPAKQSENVIRYCEKYLKHYSSTNKNKNFFLWMHITTTHGPYIPYNEFLPVGISSKDLIRIWRIIQKNNPSECDEDILRVINLLYDSVVSSADRQVGGILNMLEDVNVIDDTLIIITSDHGECFGEHNNFGHPLSSLYEESIRVPLIIVGPDIPKGKIIDNLVSLIDLPPTILDLTSTSKKPLTFCGKSFINLIFNEPESHRSYVISEGKVNDKKIFSCRSKKWKLIASENFDVMELYNLDNDLKEQNNLIGVVKSDKSLKIVFQNLLSILIAHKKQVREVKQRFEKLKIKKKFGG